MMMDSEEECTRCGRCCLNMRQYIIVGSRSGGMMRCRCSLTKEEFALPLSSFDTGQMNDPALFFKNPKACPFLKKNGQETYSCIIYDSRPAHCRSFSCRPKKET